MFEQKTGLGGAAILPLAVGRSKVRSVPGTHVQVFGHTEPSNKNRVYISTSITAVGAKQIASTRVIKCDKKFCLLCSCGLRFKFRLAVLWAIASGLG